MVRITFECRHTFHKASEDVRMLRLVYEETLALRRLGLSPAKKIWFYQQDYP